MEVLQASTHVTTNTARHLLAQLNTVHVEDLGRGGGGRGEGRRGEGRRGGGGRGGEGEGRRGERGRGGGRGGSLLVTV